jgi:hypothetical protein
MRDQTPFHGPRSTFQDPVPLPFHYRSTTVPLYADIEFDETHSVFDNCYRYLRIIRNNIIHANKAFRPDTPERLSELLSCSEELFLAVYAADCPLSERAKEIKAVLRIESF